MKYRLLSVLCLGMSFSATANDSLYEWTHTAPTATRDTMLTCNADLISGNKLTTLPGTAYIEGTGEQILYAILPTSKPGEHLLASFNAWGFTPFGQVLSREQFRNWGLNHLGGSNLVHGEVSDYTFVDLTPQEGFSEIKPKDALRIYGCQNQTERPAWTRDKSAQKYFDGLVY
ncbi:hypothetical protein AB6I73_003896 [Citrobacter amalonaticus]